MATGPRADRAFRDQPRSSRASWLGEGVAVLLADDLNGLGADAIARDERVRAFDRLQVPPQATLTRGTVIKIGQLVGATHGGHRPRRTAGSDPCAARAVGADRHRAVSASSSTSAAGSTTCSPSSSAPRAGWCRPASPRPAWTKRGRRCRRSSSSSRGCWPRRRRPSSAFSSGRCRLSPTFDRARLALGRAHAVTGRLGTRHAMRRWP